MSVAPCEPWVTGEEVADCCESFAGGTDPEAIALLEPYAEAATDILYGLSGGAFKGECGPITVRPCNSDCSCFSILDAGWAWDRLASRWYNGQRTCGCRCTSEIHLSGWPREILEVRIDGVALGGDEYRLDDGFRLVRMRDPADPSRRVLWPGCQILDLDDTEEGTFAIDYTYGVDPPQAAKDAAVALACQLFGACNPASGRCTLPRGVTALARAGVTINLDAIGKALADGATGILAIDVFLARYGDGAGQPTVWSPDIDPYPRRVGTLGT